MHKKLLAFFIRSLGITLLDVGIVLAVVKLSLAYFPYSVVLGALAMALISLFRQFITLPDLTTGTG